MPSVDQDFDKSFIVFSGFICGWFGLRVQREVAEEMSMFMTFSIVKGDFLII